MDDEEAGFPVRCSCCVESGFDTITSGYRDLGFADFPEENMVDVDDEVPSLWMIFPVTTDDRSSFLVLYLNG